MLQDLERTLGLGQPQVQDVERHSTELETCRERLNTYLQIIHTPIEPAGITPYQVVGELVRLRMRDDAPELQADQSTSVVVRRVSIEAWVPS